MNRSLKALLAIVAVAGFAAAANAQTNTPPVLAPIGSKAACAVGTPFTFAATATDADIPANTLTFSLDPGAPPGATINAVTGVFSWTPFNAGAFPATIRVTDDGAPPLSDFEAITLVVPAGAPNVPPVLGAIGNKTVNELTTLTFTATASDPSACEGGTSTFSLDAGAPAGASIDPATGAFNWTPSEAQGPGSYPITVRVTDNGLPPPPLSDSETITVAVNEVNAAPVLNAIGNRSGTLGVPVAFTAIATDTDIPANTLTFSLDPGAPLGATINGSTGAFSWTPTGSGTFPVTVRVTDSGTPTLSDFESFAIILSIVDPRPVLGPIGNKTVDELSTLAFTATATDPNPGAILTFTLDPGAPAGAILNPSTGAFMWIPAESQGPGTFPITLRVTNNATPPLSDSKTFTVTVREVNTAPVLAPIGGKTVQVGTLLAFTATATDPDIPPNTLCFTLDAGQPPGATMTCGTGVFMWTPSPGQEGLYVITVRVTDNGVPPLSDSEAITVAVQPGSSAPTADAGGPYSGTVNSPVTFDGTHSFDPNGEALTYAWNFGDGHTGTGAKPVHTYSAPGTYTVTLRVTDPGEMFGDDVTTASIQTSLPANVFFVGGFNFVLPQILGAYIRLEPIGNNFHTTDVVLPSITLSYNGVTVPARCKTISGGDTNHNGQPEIRVCFKQKDMKTLFASVGNGTTTVTATMAANLTNGGKINGDVSIRVVKFSSLDAGRLSSVSPNPLNPQAKLMFVTTAPGEASVQIFDVRGRMVRDLMQRQYLTPGVHEVTIDGRNDQGNRLSSGTYFYRIQSGEGPIKGSFQVLK